MCYLKSHSLPWCARTRRCSLSRTEPFGSGADLKVRRGGSAPAPPASSGMTGIAVRLGVVEVVRVGRPITGTRRDAHRPGPVQDGLRPPLAVANAIPDRTGPARMATPAGDGTTFEANP